ncbi:MAG TPA: outer membrane lipoprotein carrier protein LolA [Candidatus Polarisedimenticolaceae bacterium]|nr:outer membrane lipoprotein carrier protein LolA [Candidatus Polarisedimenticolaceae bacterium]
MASKRATTNGTKRRLAALCVATGLAAAATVAADDRARPRDAGTAVAGLQAWLDATDDLEAAFSQALVSGAFGAGLEEAGRLYVKRPGRMRWDYRDPDRKIAIVDGDRTWLYLEEEAQLMLGRLGEHGTLLPALIVGDRALDELFEAELVPAAEGQRDGTVGLRLRPRPAADSFESVLVTLRPPEFAIERAEVLDAAGNRMLYRFSKLKRNRGLPDGLFRLAPPDGTSVVGSH